MERARHTTAIVGTRPAPIATVSVLQQLGGDVQGWVFIDHAATDTERERLDSFDVAAASADFYDRSWSGFGFTDT